MIFRSVTQKNTYFLLFPALIFVALFGTESLSAKQNEKRQKASTNFDFVASRKKMAQKLPDLERIDLIVHEFKKLSRNCHFSKKTALAFENWLINKIVFVGSVYYDHDRVYERMPHLKKSKKFRTAYKKFVANVTTKLPAQHQATADKIQKNITILFTGCYGGGHKAPALALAKHFERCGHNIQLIDVDEVEDRYSPRIKGYTKAQIYAEVYQKQGDANKARKLSEKINKAQSTSSRKFIGDLKKMISDFAADHIFTVAHHKPKLSYLSYQLGIPMTYVHTDHEFNQLLLPVLTEQAKLNARLVKFGTLTNDKSFLKPIFKSLKTKDWRLYDALEKQLVHLDFPVRESFYPVSPEEKNRIRDALDIPRDAVVCKLAMGQNGLAKDINELLERIVQEENNVNRDLYVFVVCGKNEALKNELEESVTKMLGDDSNIHIKILGFLAEKEMAQVDQASDLWITKPGGSTCAELVQTQKQMLYILNPDHPWEKSNAKYLKKLNLAQILSDKIPFVKQIQTRIDVHRAIDLQRLPRLNWQNQANQILIDPR